MHAPQFRCFGEGDPLYERYHDEEWGRPVRDDARSTRSSASRRSSSGLAWITILRKRDALPARVRRLRPATVARFGKPEVNRLLADA